MELMKKLSEYFGNKPRSKYYSPGRYVVPYADIGRDMSGDFSDLLMNKKVVKRSEFSSDFEPIEPVKGYRVKKGGGK